MTTRDQQVARALKRANEELTELPDSPEARARTVAALQAAMQAAAPAPAPRATTKRAPWLALAAALPLLLGAGWWLNLQRSTVGIVVETGKRLANADSVESGAGVLTLSLRHGVKVKLQPQSLVELRDDGTRVLVRRGEVAAEVTSLDEPFTVESFDTLVATRSGRFQVKPGAGCDGRPEVRVSEGSVSVDGVEVQAGESWPRCAVTTTAPPEPVKDVPSPAVVRPAPVGVSVKKSTPPPPAPLKEEDRLARQNELYQQAVALQRQGDVTGAVKKLEAVLADQRSPLAETALAQKMRWLSVMDRAAAREVARDYLQRFPMGFGRADAETLVLEPK